MLERVAPVLEDYDPAVSRRKTVSMSKNNRRTFLGAPKWTVQGLSWYERVSPQLASSWLTSAAAKTDAHPRRRPEEPHRVRSGAERVEERGARDLRGGTRPPVAGHREAADEERRRRGSTARA